MIAHLRTLLAELGWALRLSRRQRRSKKSCKAPPRPEALEQRLVLSSYAAAGLGAPSGCCCPLCTGQAYTFAGQENGTTPGYKWNQSAPGAPVTISYSYSNLLDGNLGGGLSAAAIKAAIQEALTRWASVAPLNFVEGIDVGPMPSPNNYDGNGSAMMRFGHRPIDGAYNVLAYGYYPGAAGIAGDIQFDTSESWSVNPGAGMDLLEVATHEIGHALGLGHEPMPANGGQHAIMNPYYAGRFQGLGTSYLLPDDVNGIQAVYGGGGGSVVPLAPQEPPGGRPAFVVQGDRLTVVGTVGTDNFRVQVTADAFLVACNTYTYTASRSQIRTIVFEGGASTDVATIIGGTETETGYFEPRAAALIGPGYAIYTRGTEGNTIQGAAGERVNFGASPGEDHFVATPAFSRMVGPGFENVAYGFGDIAAAGQLADKAWLYDTPSNDSFVATPYQAWISGPSYRSLVIGFGWVDAESSGGYDQAWLYDSVYDELFIATPTQSWMNGPGYMTVATNFAWVAGIASTGYDRAFLYDSAGNDGFVSTPSQSWMTSGSYANTAVGFDAVTAVGGTGADTAYVYDSPGDDTLSTGGHQALYVGAERTVNVLGFDVVAAHGTSGRNRRTPWAASFTTLFNGPWE